jgi:hypothetical protein
VENQIGSHPSRSERFSTGSGLCQEKGSAHTVIRLKIINLSIFPDNHPVENLWKSPNFCGKPVEKYPKLLTGINTLWKTRRVFHSFSTGCQGYQSIAG